MSSAQVKIWDTVVGYLSWGIDQVVFEPEQDYIDSPLNIAPLLHSDKASRLEGTTFNEKFHGMIPTFTDSLPDSFGDIVFKEWLEQQHIDQSQMNPIERLLYVGTRGMGAMEYFKGKEIQGITDDIDLEELAAISDKIIKRKYDQRDYLHNPEALRNILTIGSSVGGAQAKILTAITRDADAQILAGDVIHDIPVDYYVVKLEHDSHDVWNREKNYVEYVYNQIARDMGINVAESRLIQEGGRAHFASKRFDRVDNQKVHMQTVHALTGFFGRNTEFSYEEIFKIIAYLKLPYPDMEQLFLQMTFNVLASNRDDHTKNFSFLMDRTGQWSLSPAYDLTYPFDPYQSFPVPHKISINKKVQNIDRNDLVAVAQKAGILRYNSLIDQAVECIASFHEKIRPYDLNKRTVDLIQKDLERNISRVKSS